MKKSTLKIALIAALVVFAIVPAIILGAVGTFTIAKYGSDIQHEELEKVSLSRATALDMVFSGYMADASALSMNANIIKTINGGAAGDAEIKAIAGGSSDILDILIVSSTGTVLQSVSGKQKSSFEHFTEDGTLPSVSGLVSWESYGKDAVFVSSPIYANPDDRTGGMLGYVIVVADVTNAEAGIGKALSGKYLDGNAHMMIIDEEGNAVNFDGNGTAMKSAQVDSAFTGSNTQSIFDSTNNISEDLVITNVRSEKFGKYTAVYGFIPNNVSWRWVGFVESGAIGGFAVKTNIILWIACAVVVVIAFIIASVVIGKFIGNMHDMVRTMNSTNVSEGISAMRFTVKNEKSELGSIQKTFNDFLDEVELNSQRYRTISDLSNNMLFEWDYHKESMYVSDNTLAKFDINTTTSTLSNGRFIDALMSKEDAEKYKRDVNTMLKKQTNITSEYQLTSKSGTPVWVSVSMTVVTDRVGEALRVIGVMTDIDNEKKMELQLSERASYDFLSQLYNRPTFIRKLSAELDRRGPKKIAVTFIDVDDFKFINDRYGHTVGDEVIRYVADTIKVKVEDRGGFAGRFGGDEFVLCFTDQDDIAKIDQIAMDLIDELYVGYTTSDSQLINVRASIGIAFCPDHTEDVNELLSFSDTAMYFVKKNGKTNYHIYVPEDSASGEYIDPEGY